MSNVLYRCPECGDRVFAIPNQTNLKYCPRHPDAVYEQQEQYAGADFLNEGGKHINTGQGRPGGDYDVKHEYATKSDGALADLQNEYERITGSHADRRWGVERLQSEIETAKAEKEAEEE